MTAVSKEIARQHGRLPFGKTMNSRVGDFLGRIAQPIGKLFGEGPKLPDFPALEVGPDAKSG